MSANSGLTEQAVEALLRRERICLLGRLSRGLVHNVSGAIQMVRLPLDLLELRLGMGQTDDVKPKLESAQQGLNRLTEEISLLSAKSSQMHRLEPSPMDLAALAREQMAFWPADPYFKHELKIEAELTTTVVTAPASYADVALAFNALLANAVESLQASGNKGLRVSCAVMGNRAVLALGDDGPGPSPQMAATMFDAFVTDKGPEHDGLGLFLASRALAPHGGELAWDRERPREFTISLPLAAA